MQSGVLGETLGEILSGLRVEIIVVETANESQIGASAGHDSRKCVCGGVLELRERFVDGEGN